MKSHTKVSRTNYLSWKDMFLINYLMARLGTWISLEIEFGQMTCLDDQDVYISRRIWIWISYKIQDIQILV